MNFCKHGADDLERIGGEACQVCLVEEIDVLKFKLSNVTTERDVAWQEIERLKTALGIASQIVNEKTEQLTAANAKVEKEYKRGLEAGIREYAWWKDGEQFVGTCGKTLQQALADTEDK